MKTTTSTTPLVVVWFRRIAAAGFLFFLIKGLVWLAIGLTVVLWSL